MSTSTSEIQSYMVLHKNTFSHKFQNQTNLKAGSHLTCTQTLLSSTSLNIFKYIQCTIHYYFPNCSNLPKNLKHTLSCIMFLKLFPLRECFCYITLIMYNVPHNSQSWQVFFQSSLRSCSYFCYVNIIIIN